MAQMRVGPAAAAAAADTERRRPDSGSTCGRRSGAATAPAVTRSSGFVAGQTVRPRRLVMLADISGSMEPYARAYLQLLHSAAGGANAETFVFATRLTRLTGSCGSATPTPRCERAAAAAPDWAGGTRLGDALKAFNDGWGRRGMARGAVVLVVSDGWDGGDPTIVAEQMARPGAARSQGRLGQSAQAERIVPTTRRGHGGSDAAHR